MSAFTTATDPHPLMNAPRLLTAVLAVAVLLTIVPVGFAKQDAVDAVPDGNAFPKGNYFVTVGVVINSAISGSGISLLDPELVQIGNRTFVSGIVCDASFGARRSEFSGQKAFVAFDAIISMQRYPDEK